ncbi:MAG: nucleotidyl transferase AbiEii/AbiGii toxin family protein [Candidatus Paceibacterota bacterium]
MHPETIDKQTKSVLDTIGSQEFIQPFYLAGGTALAIHLGHRMSIDLDFFTDQEFSVKRVRDRLAKLGDLSVEGEDADGTLNGVLDGVLISFFQYSYPNVYPTISFEGVQLADERDIAAMKIDAISNRGKKKDFVDLYFLLKKYSLKEILDFFEVRFQGIEYNRLHILKSLTYFEDAEDDPDPIMLIDVPWKEMKDLIVQKVKKMEI